MSESVYSGESYHSGNHDKYSTPFQSSGESMVSSESSYDKYSNKYSASLDFNDKKNTANSNNDMNPIPLTPSSPEMSYENQQIEKAKELLKRSEAHLTQKASILSVDKNDVREILRNIMVRYEDEIIQYPNATTLLTSFNALYEDNSRIKPEMKDLFTEGLNELEFEEKKNSSKLKYW